MIVLKIVGLINIEFGRKRTSVLRMVYPRQCGRSERARVLRGHRLAAGVPSEVHAAADPAARRGQRRRRIRHRQLRRGGH